MIRDFILRNKSLKECFLYPSEKGEPVVPPEVPPVTWGALLTKSVRWETLHNAGITWGDLTEGVEI